MKRKSTFILIIILLITITIGAYYLFLYPVYYIGIDINPAMELAINRFNKVVDIVSLNKEADILLSDLKLKDQNMNVAVDQIIRSANELGYIDDLASDNVILFSVYSSNKSNIAKAEDELYLQVKKYMDDNNIASLLLFDHNNSERMEKANHYGISYEKMLLVQKALVLNPTLNPSDIAKSSVADIIAEIKEAREDNKKEVENDSKELIAKKQELKSLYYDNYSEKVEELCSQTGKPCEEKVKEQVIQEQKSEAIKEVNIIRNKLHGDWCNQVDNLDTKVNQNIKNKIIKLKDKWSLSK